MTSLESEAISLLSGQFPVVSAEPQQDSLVEKLLLTQFGLISKNQYLLPRFLQVNEMQVSNSLNNNNTNEISNSNKKSIQKQTRISQQNKRQHYEDYEEEQKPVKRLALISTAKPLNSSELGIEQKIIESAALYVVGCKVQLKSNLMFGVVIGEKQGGWRIIRFEDGSVGRYR